MSELKKIGYLGGGAWGFCLATLLARKGHKVNLWPGSEKRFNMMKNEGCHPSLDGGIDPNITLCKEIAQTVQGVDFIVESVTAGGIRPVFQQLKELGVISIPIVLTSKGIEQESGLLMHEVVTEILGSAYKKYIGTISGPSLAKELHIKQPTSVVCSAYDRQIMDDIRALFTTDFFRVYPNPDIKGVSFSGAMKNIIAIACGISDGLGFGDNSKSALMTRGLHEIRKLATRVGAEGECLPETINGLAGMGDLCVTCASNLSRNHRFGQLIARGYSESEAKAEIKMVVEGISTCLAARDLGLKLGIDLPITEGVYAVLRKGVKPLDAVKMLLTRDVKPEEKL